jgi:hypothetical protein
MVLNSYVDTLEVKVYKDIEIPERQLTMIMIIFMWITDEL